MIRDTDFSTFKRPHTWTFTFKYDQSIQSAKKKMRHFLNVLINKFMEMHHKDLIKD